MLSALSAVVAATRINGPHRAFLFALAWVTAIFFPVAVSGQSAESSLSPLRVLFIGNSHLYLRDVPGIVSTLSRSPASPRRIEVLDLSLPDAGLLRNLSGRGPD